MAAGTMLSMVVVSHCQSLDDKYPLPAIDIHFDLLWAILVRLYHGKAGGSPELSGKTP